MRPERNTFRLAERIAQTQGDILARTLSALVADPTPETFVGQVLSVMLEHCGAHGAALWLDDPWINKPSIGEVTSSLRFVHQVWALEEGTALRRRVGHQTDRVMFSATRANVERMQRGGVIRHDWRAILEQECYLPHREVLLAAGVRNIAYVPLFFGRDYRGFISLRFDNGHALTEEDEAFALALANQVIVALELGQAAYELREAEVSKERHLVAEARIADLVRVNAALSSALTGLQNFECLDTFFRKTLTAAASIFGASGATLFLVNGNRRRMVVAYGVRNGEPIDVATNPDVAYWKQSDSPDTADDLEFWDKTFADPRYSWAALDDPSMPLLGQRMATRRGQVAIARVPLWHNGRPLGVLGFGFSHDRRPTETEVELVRVVVQQVTLAYEFMRLGAEGRDAAVVREREQAAVLRLSQLEAANVALARSTAELSVQHDLQAYLGILLQTFLQCLRFGPGSGSLWLLQPDGSQRLALLTTGETVRSFTSGEASANEEFHAKATFLTFVESQSRRSSWMTDDVATAPALGGLGHIRVKLVSSGVRAMLKMPVVAGDQHFGSMVACLETPCNWSAEQIELAQAQANQAALAMEMRRLGDVAQQGAITEERNRFAREIHDTLAQDFLAIAAHLQSARRKLAASDLSPVKAGAIAAALDIALETAQDGLVEARRSVWGLVPRSLENGGGLASALRAAADRIAPGRACVSESGAPRALPVEVESELLGIVREAVSNAARHAGGQASINVHIKYEEDAAHVSVEDDGTGCDLVAAENSRLGHFGLWTMRERAARIGGRLELLSAAGQGTCVAISVPWPT